MKICEKCNQEIFEQGKIYIDTQCESVYCQCDKNTHKSHPKKCRHFREGYVTPTLQYCEQCDCVYCELCGEEWKKENINWSFTVPFQTGTTTLSPFINCNHKIN